MINCILCLRRKNTRSVLKVPEQIPQEALESPIIYNNIMEDFEKDKYIGWRVSCLMVPSSYKKGNA